MQRRIAGPVWIYSNTDDYGFDEKKCEKQRQGQSIKF